MLCPFLLQSSRDELWVQFAGLVFLGAQNSIYELALDVVFLFQLQFQLRGSLKAEVLLRLYLLFALDHLQKLTSAHARTRFLLHYLFAKALDRH